jgi:hypothetical protein
MTPDRRLDQLEPLVADVLQKVDRLIEGQGQLLELIGHADQNADIAARGLANLTAVVDKLATDQAEGLRQVSNNIDDLKATQNEILTLLRERLK